MGADRERHLKSATAAAEPLEEPAGVKAGIVRIGGRTQVALANWSLTSCRENDAAPAAKPQTMASLAGRHPV